MGGRLVRRAVAGAFVLAVALAGPAMAGSSSTTYLGDIAHDNRVDGAPGPPLGVRWVLDMGGDVGYPVVSGGRAFVVSRGPDNAPYGTMMSAVDLADGHVAWTRAIATTYYWAGHAVDAGRLFVVNGDGTLQALSPADGGSLWTTQLPGQYSFSSPPVADAGRVYLGGAGSGGTLYAVDAASGKVVWSKPVANGDDSSPALDESRVYVTYACNQTYAFDRATGALAWHHDSSCSGGGGATSALHAGRLFTMEDGGLVFDAASGNVVDSIASTVWPAYADGASFTATGPAVRSANAVGGAERWARGVDGTAIGNLLVAGSHLYATTEAGQIAAFDRASGTPEWCGALGAPISAGANRAFYAPPTALGGGEGVLLVQAGRFLVALAAGGSPLGACSAAGTTGGETGTGGGGGSGTGSGGGTTGPSLTLRPSHRHVTYRARVTLRATLSGVVAPSTQRVKLLGDRWPFGTWRRVANARADGAGIARFRVRPDRNTRYHVEVPGLPALGQAEATVYAELRPVFRRTLLGSGRFRERLELTGPRRLRLGGRRIFFYTGRRGATTVRRVASARLRRVAPGRHAAAAVLRARGSLRSTVVVACMHESRDDGYGEPVPQDAWCGERRRLAMPKVRR